MRSWRPLPRDRLGLGRGPRPFIPIKIRGRFRLRQTVKAAEVTTVRNAHAQVAQDAAMRIDEQIGLDHGLAGALVDAGTTLPRPFRSNSTSRRFSVRMKVGVVAKSRSAPFLSRRL